MLVEFDRVNGYGNDSGAKIGINPVAVGALHESGQHVEVSIVRLFDGRGYLVRGDYDTVRAQLPNVNLVEFARVGQFGGNTGRKIGINPDAVGTIHGSISNPGTSIIRLFDGRGYSVLGDYTEVSGKLRGEEPEPANRNEGIRLISDNSSNPRRSEFELEDSEIDEDDED